MCFRYAVVVAPVVVLKVSIDQSGRKSTSVDVTGRVIISVEQKALSFVVDDKDSLNVVGTRSNYEDKSTVGDSQKGTSLTQDSDTRLRDLENESKPFQEESRSQSKGDNMEKRAPIKEKGSAQNNTEGNEAANTEQSSSKGI